MRQCPQCGFLAAELVGSINLGCAQCYTAFHDLVSPVIWNYQGSTVHHGDVPPLRRVDSEDESRE